LVLPSPVAALAVVVAQPSLLSLTTFTSFFEREQFPQQQQQRRDELADLAW
jgi:hypothetical protein